MTKVRHRICKWCKEPFTVPRKRKYNAVKYCCEEHRVEARREQTRQRVLKYLKRWEDVLEQRAHDLGSSNLREKPKKDYEEELKAILKEIRRLGL